jgi:hypothetical protein
MASSSTPQPTAEERFAEVFPEVAEESARFKREFQPSGVIEWGVSHLEHGVSHLAPTAARLGRSCKAQANAKNATATAAAASAAAAAAAATAAEADDWSVWMRIEASAAAAAAAVAPRGSIAANFREREANDALLLEAASQQSCVVDNPEAAPAAAEPEVADTMAAMHATYRAQCEAEERLSQLRDQQARVDWHNEAASQPSPWSDMDETSCRVGNPAGSVIRFPFAVDESGAVSIIAPPGGGSPCTACHVQHSGSCCFFDLLRADVEKLGLYLELLPSEPILSGAIYLTMCEIHTTLTERVITEDIYVQLHSLVQHIVKDCNLLPIFNPGA